MFEFLKSWFKSNAIQETKESKESINFRDLDVDDIVYYGGRTFFLDTVEELEPDIFLYNFSDRDYEYSLWFSIVVGNDFVNYAGGSFFTYDILEGDGYSDDFGVNDITISETFSRI